MRCENCGSEITPNNKYCSTCGEKVNNDTIKSTPKTYGWLLPVILFITCLLVIFYYFSFSNEFVDNVIKKQLNAIKDKHFTEAYYEYTTKEFQNTTSLETFREFLNNNSIFNDNSSIEFSSNHIEDNIGKVQTILTDKNGSQGKVLYSLDKDSNNKWKIQYIQILEVLDNKNVSETPLDKELLAPIEKQLKALKSNNIQEAYEKLVSTDFLKQTPLPQFKIFIGQYPILTQFNNYKVASHSIEKNQGAVTIILNQHEDNIPLEYKLVKEGGEWKIWSLQIVLPDFESSSNGLMHPKELGPVIENFLKMMKEKQVDEGYRDLTSPEFKKATHLKDFHEFVNKFPILETYTSYQINNEIIKNAEYGFVNVEMSDEKEKYEIEFTLGIENKTWKIWGIQINNKTNQNLQKSKVNEFSTADKHTIIEVIQRQLLAIREKNIQKAYDEFTSKEFRESTSYDKFEEFIADFPVFFSDYQAKFPYFTFDNNIAVVSGTLTVNNETEYNIEYQLVKEGKEWRVLHIVIKQKEKNQGNKRSEMLGFKHVYEH